MPDIEGAARLAQRFLDEETGPGDAPLALVAEERAHVGGLYYFGCQSVACLRSGEFRDMAVGTGGVSVDAETGTCRVLGAVEAAGLDLFRRAAPHRKQVLQALGRGFPAERSA